MSPKLKNFLKSTASLQNTWLLASLFLIMVFIIMPDAKEHIKSYGQDLKIIDDCLFYSPNQLYELLNAYCAKGRQIYIVVELTADLFCSIVTAAFLCSLLIYSSSQMLNRSVDFPCYLGLTLLIIITNALENISIIWMLYHYPEVYFYLAVLSSFFTFSKWMLLGACSALAIWNLTQMSFHYSIKNRLFSLPSK